MELLSSTSIFGNSLLNWLIAVSIGVAFLLVSIITRLLLCRQFKARINKHDTPFWHSLLAIVQKGQLLFLVIIAIFFGSLVLTVPEKARHLINVVAIVAFLIQFGYSYRRIE